MLIYLHTVLSLLDEALERINADIREIVGWASGNELSLNAGKTSEIIFGTTRYVYSINLQATSNIIVDGATIP